MRKLMEAVKLNEGRRPSRGEMPKIKVVKQILVIDDYGDTNVFSLKDMDDAIEAYAEAYAEHMTPPGSSFEDTKNEWEQEYKKAKKYATHKLKSKPAAK